MKTVKAASLYFTEGSSNKEYHAQLAEVEGGFVVNFQYGRRGSALKSETKTPEPLPKDKAEKAFDKLVQSKEAKGYTRSETGEVFSSKAFEAKKTSIRPQLLNPIEDSELERYLTDDGFLAQEKFDGERRLVEVSGGKVTGINRKGLACQLPEVLEKCFKVDMIIDCEIVGSTLYAFDLLSLEDADMTPAMTMERLMLLSSVKIGKNVKIAKSANSTAEKRALLKELQDRGAEGIVFKKKVATYTAGRPSSGGSALKYKFYKTASVIVLKASETKRSVAIAVLEGKKSVAVGNVTIPENHEIPAAGAVVEVRYLYAYKGGSLFQPVYLGVRADIDPEEATIAQLVYKEESA
jgi:bifunctional non-homologous end joining protein LigD